ncbi:hypothetical protein [Aquimarina longa]|uniref:hypothetical protein n=1 Tax=Aquimarina longa TaxID=1080221 RepID=UPI00078426BE|nr:hypothetical protein [Aquimarina longa]
MLEKRKKNYFPDPLELDEVKKTKVYGLQVAKAIGEDWFNGGYISNDCNFANRRTKIKNNRLYSRGRQDISTYKKLLEDLNFMNVDWTPLNIAGKFIDIVTNGIREDLYRTDISAIDRIATLDKKKYKEKLQKYMRTKSMLEKTKQTLGIDLVPKGFIPQDDEELDMHMSLDYKPKIEIAEEELITYVKLCNDWKVTKSMVDRDLVENALGSVRCYTEKTNGVVLKYVDIENYLHSYTQRTDFSDCHYHGVVEKLTISEIKRVSGFDDMTLRRIAQAYSSLNGNATYDISDFDHIEINEVLDLKVSVLYYTYKTSKTITSKKESKVLDTWYEGSYIIGSEYIYNYKECEILSRDSLNRALPPFITFASDIYKNDLHSLSERMQPTIEQMQRIHLKIQQLVAMIRPDETEIDIDLLAELESKTGKKLTWEDAIALYNSKGIVLSTRVDMGEEGIKDRPALRVPTQMQSGKLEQLTRVWVHYYNMIRDLTGVNAARDGSQPSDVLVGVQKMQLLQSNTATQGIFDASLEITRKTVETISTRLGDVFRWGKELKEVYKNAVGTHNLDVIESLDDRHVHEFGFVIQLLPTETEIQEFKESLNIALQEGSIKVDDKVKAERIAKMNIKQAETFLTYRRKKNLEEEKQARQEEIQAQSQSNAQAAQQAEEAKRQTLQQESEVRIMEYKQLAIIDVMKQKELNKVNEPMKEREYEIDVFIEKLKSSGRIDENIFKEDRKDSRQKMSDTHTSKMIEQRKKETSAINFENGEGINDTIPYFSNS